jgi:hypothetical protein
MSGWITLLDGNSAVRDTNHLIGDIKINAGTTNLNLSKWPRDVWHLIDLVPYGIPIDAKAVDVFGEIQISTGAHKGTAECEIAFKPPSEPTSVAIHSRYSMQALTNGGMPESEIVFTSIVPEAGKIHFGWRHTPGTALDFSKGTPAISINLVFKRWMR